MNYKKLIRGLIFTGTLLMTINNDSGVSYADINTDISLIMHEVYDDNVLLKNEEAQSDYRNDIGVEIKAAYEEKNRFVNISSNITRHTYNELNEFNNTSLKINMDGRQEFSQYHRISAEDVFVKAFEPLDFVDEFGNIAEKYKYESNTFNLNYSRDITKDFVATLLYENNLYRSFRDDLSDSDLNKGGFVLNYSITPQTNIMTLYEYHKREYDLTNVETNRLALGIVRKITNQLYASFYGGVDLTKQSNSNSNDGEFISIILDDTIDENSSLQLSYLKKITATSSFQDIFDSQQGEIIFKRQLLQKLKVFFSGFWGQGTFTNSNIEDIFYGISTEFVYGIKKDVTLSAFYSYSVNDSDRNTRSYSRNFAGFKFKILVAEHD